ncbi:hypothetical protein HPP92_020188 [Vanilla planifolia]|uniref:RAVE complex protein Rav1 C-terminal domain-containing protein n=1 Tax=Vanilla planifolia TaxID=51239 RepID=A0A835Q1W6_VANPL|nr:hypothetical protein HPP92_020188 [Vanilla planifolia]
MAGEADFLPPSGGISASAASVGAEDISKLLPLSLVRSQLVPSAPNRRRLAIDFLFDFGGSSWIAYGASSLLVVSHFPSPIPECGNLVGPFFRQVIEPIASGAANGLAVNAVSWCPTRPSDGEVAAALGNSILFYAPQPDQDSGSFCWKMTTCIRKSSIIEAIEWTGSGEGIVAAGIEVSLWRRNGISWVMAWKSVADVPQVLVSATWSADGLVSTSAGFLLNSGDGSHNSPFLSKEDCRPVSVYHGDGKSGVTKIQLLHPKPVSMIRWRPSSPIKLTTGTSNSWRDMLLTCCFDGAVRLWSEVNNGRSRKASKEINDHSTTISFQVVAVIEMNQCLNGMLGRDIFVDWAVDLAFVVSKCEGGVYSLSSDPLKRANISPCEWIISTGPVNSVAFWSVHCLDDSTPFRSPRVSLWKKQIQSGNPKCESIHPVEKPILVKVIAMRNQLFGPPDACSLLQLLPGNSMNWWHFYSPLNNDSSQESFPQVNKENCLSHFAAGVLNLDGHAETILQLALHPHSYEVELAASLDSSGSIFFWSLSTNLNSTISLQKFIHPNWKLLGKIRSQDLSSDFKYLALVWAPLVLDGKPLLLLGYSGGIDGFMIEVSGEEKNILYLKLFNVPFVGHCHFEGLPDHMFATPLASCSDCFLLSGVWINSCRILSWKVVLQSEGLSGTMCVFSSDSKSILMPEKENNGTFHELRRYSATVYPISWKFPDSQGSKTVTCVSVTSLDHSLINMEQFADCGNGSCEDSFSIMATGCSDGTLQLWKVPSRDSTFSTSDCIQCNPVGLFAAHNGPVNAVSLSKCGARIATVSNGGHNSKSVLHIWMPICLIGGGGFLLEGVLSIDDTVVALRWLTIGNGRLLLGVCMPNELRIYSERRSDICLVEYDKSSDTHTWCCIALSPIYHRCHDFLWGPKLTPVLLHEKQITVLSELLSETDYNHSGFGSSFSVASTGDNLQITGELMQHDCMESGMNSNIFFSGVFMKNNDVGGRIRYHNLLDIVDKMCGPLEFYHPQALIQNLYTGNWKRAYTVLRHIADSVKPLKASMGALDCSGSGKFCNIPRIGLLNYLEGTTTTDSGTNKLQWGQGNTYGSFTFEKINLQFCEVASKSREPLSSYSKSVIMVLVDTIEDSLDLISLTKIERIQILTILDILLELCNTSFTCVYESLDEPGRRSIHDMKLCTLLLLGEMDVFYFFCI